MVHASTRFVASIFACLFLFFDTAPLLSQPTAVSRDMVFNLSGLGNAYHLFDGDRNTVFEPKHAAGFTATPATVILRCSPDAFSCKLKKIRFEPAAGAQGTLRIFVGSPGTGNWTEWTTQPIDFQPPAMAFEWHPHNLEVRFLKFIFEKKGELIPQHFPTGEFFLELDGDCSFSDPLADCAAAPDACPFNHLPFEARMGVNNFVGKSQLFYQTAPFAAVREYLPWDHIQGHAAANNSETDGTRQPYHFSPSFPGYDLDGHYRNLHNFGREVLGTFKESSPFQINFNYENTGNSLTMNQLGMSFASVGAAYLDLVERKPGQPSNGTSPNNPQFSLPETYIDHARALQQLDLRYGREGNPNLASPATPQRANLGVFSFLENWNEQDKWWLRPAVGSPVRPDLEQRLAFFTPQEYMAMTYADRFLGGDGIHLPLIMSGITEFDAEYVRGCYMAWWELTGEDPALNFPFAALNLHHYSVENWQRGIFPEGDAELDPANPHAGLMRIIAFRNRHLPQQQIWVTEFGYSDHPRDATAALPHYPNPDLEEVQAQWLVRNYLLFNRLGIDRAFTYQLTDDGPNAWHGMFNHTGVIDRTDSGGWLPEFRLKKSWYYLFTLRNRLAGFYFKNFKKQTTSSGRPMWVYLFENQDLTKKISVIWTPTDTHPDTDGGWLDVAPAERVTLVELAHQNIVGTETPLDDADGDGKIFISNIGERPLLVLHDAQPIAPPTCDCYTPLTFSAGDASAAALLTDDFSPAAEHPRCQYGFDAKSKWSGAAGTVTFNLNGSDALAEREVAAIFVHDPADGNPTGHVFLEFLASDGSIVHQIACDLGGQPLYPFNVLGKNFVWQRFENLNFRATQLRLTKSENASVGEILICSKGENPCPNTGIAPAAPQQLNTDIFDKKLKINWLENTTPHTTTFFQFYDVESGNAISQKITASTPPIFWEMNQLPCGKTIKIEIKSRSCDGRESAAASAIFETPACTPAPPTDPPVPPIPSADCRCEPVPVVPVSVAYELKNGQSMPPTFTPLGDVCADAVPDQLPARMFDEQDKIWKICDENYLSSTSGSDFYHCDAAAAAQFPVQEWFAGWSGYPFSAIIQLSEPMPFHGIYLYDSYDKGKISIEYRENATGGAWKTLKLPNGKNYLTESWRKWVQVFDSPQVMFAEAFRVTVHDPAARFSELALCQHPTVRKISSADSPTGMAAKPQIFPNPSVGEVNLVVGDFEFDALQLTDVLGRVVWQNQYSSSKKVEKLDFRGISTGIYFLTMEKQGQKIWQHKLILKN